MKTVYKTIKIKLNAPLLNYKKGQTVTLATNKAGKVVSAYWVSRLKDAEIDGCITVLTDSETQKSKNKGKKS